MARLKDRYAEALFQLSVEDGKLHEYMEQAVFVLDALQGGEYEGFLVHPHIPDTAKRELLQNLFANRVSGDLISFLCLTVAKNRESLIVPVLSSYIEMGKRYLGKVVANVVSAARLRDEQVLALSSVLSKKLGKRVEIQLRMDPDLIGGFYIHVDGRLIDRTVRTQLENMKECIEAGGAR